MRRYCFRLAATLLSMAAPSSGKNADALVITILSSNCLDATAGDFVTIKATMRNRGGEVASNVTTYLSLADMGNKLPVDLEDWSVEKGLFIGTIEADQILPLEWKIHFVKAGDYSLAVIAIAEGNDTPLASRLTYFHVKPKITLNPGYVLPVALGMPVALTLMFFLLNYRRSIRVRKV